MVPKWAVLLPGGNKPGVKQIREAGGGMLKIIHSWCKICKAHHCSHDSSSIITTLISGITTKCNQFPLLKSMTKIQGFTVVFVSLSARR